MKTIGEKIKELRESKDLSAKDLCAFIDINTSTYSKLENDKKSIDVEELKKLTNFYDVSADYILGTNDIQEDIVMYMKRDKNLNNSDIEEVQMILSMMDEAITLQNMRERI
ncbi:helix-turn-helix transcriptional regulator [Proteiniborus sp. MB09-C3]|uniref:helix-turn-helix domain-containing protein n=1 Tax=Proteiniborus sp. MB09-C3 TaxID=3050072 RepID=UPI0025553ABA|nr:helix-turn-helix transcriptional regulator [Proteiniborus sp. MB09-C3]WIV13242.1 helix-turn-helix transcriptional regulator [Proteiniborus sp. MB09-C3]